MKKLPVIIATLFWVGAAFAHHGSNAQFDQSKTVELSGTITGIRWVNPHSYIRFDVVGADGEVAHWRCEMRAAAVLNRSGWSKDMFREGAHIDIIGAPARREEHTCYVHELRIDGGPEIMRYEQFDETEDETDVPDRPAVLPNGQPNISGDWAAPVQLLQEGELRRRSAEGFRGHTFKRSAAGEAAAANFDARRDNPRYNCQAVNIIPDWIFDQHVNHIEQTDDTIVLRYGFMDLVRTIHLDMDEHPQSIEPTRAGHSIGHWDGNTLIVDTVGFAPGYLDGLFGIMHSDQLHVVERFEFDPDNLSLLRDYTGEDPLYLAEPFSDRDVVFLTETPFESYDCEDLTADFGDID